MSAHPDFKKRAEETMQAYIDSHGDKGEIAKALLQAYREGLECAQKIAEKESKSPCEAICHCAEEVAHTIRSESARLG